MLFFLLTYKWAYVLCYSLKRLQADANKRNFTDLKSFNAILSYMKVHTCNALFFSENKIFLHIRITICTSMQVQKTIIFKIQQCVYEITSNEGFQKWTFLSFKCWYMTLMKYFRYNVLLYTFIYIILHSF